MNLPATALVLRQPRLTIWTILDSVIDLMYGWITYLDWKEAESLSQTQALMHQFHGADPGLTAEQRRVGTVMATWALRGRGGGGGGRGGIRTHTNHGGYPQSSGDGGHRGGGYHGGGGYQGAQSFGQRGGRGGGRGLGGGMRGNGRGY